MSELWKGRRPGRLRVVQWATGKVGASSLKAVIGHPKLDLVGLWVHSPEKEGRDAGALVGLPPTGVKATRSLEAIIALEPDCVLYMPEGFFPDELCRLLESGANIVTTRGELHNPAKIDPALRERIETACRRGGTSIHCVGSSPGFITEALPIVLLSIQRRLDCLTVNEYADMVAGCSAAMLFDTLGYGQPLSALPKDRLLGTHIWFAHSFGTVADAIGLPFDDIRMKGELAAAKSPVQVEDRVIAPGTLAAERITVAGLRKGKPLLQFRAHWYATKDIDADWDLRDTGWRVVVEGDTPLDVDIHFPIPPDQIVDTLGRYTAHRPVNAIPYVCAAAPGIRTTADLPQVIAYLG
jgi:hypothetical protein